MIKDCEAALRKHENFLLRRSQAVEELGKLMEV